MVAGGDTFFHSILTHLGFENHFKHTMRYPEISLEDLHRVEVIFLSSEPYPFKEKHLEALQSVFSHQKIYLVDGEAFSWYGTRIIKSQPYYQQLRQMLF
ncbi:helical backbone metal receptor [Riemerella columbina]|uniref:helical backbone metal receptor n=1 Tax=Riemerella columbina TaxID=103810 RepID=UPI00266F5A17|nr:helical backbone metal receptor [Riemerella columbina]WKS94623.1 helical backbone metal receptor [Riemerella columbina]